MELSLDEKFYDEIEDDIELNFDNTEPHSDKTNEEILAEINSLLEEMNLIEEEGSVNPIGQEELSDFFEYSEDIIDKRTVLPMSEPPSNCILWDNITIPTAVAVLKAITDNYATEDDGSEFCAYVAVRVANSNVYNRSDKPIGITCELLTTLIDIHKTIPNSTVRFKIGNEFLNLTDSNLLRKFIIY